MRRSQENVLNRVKNLKNFQKLLSAPPFPPVKKKCKHDDRQTIELVFLHNKGFVPLCMVQGGSCTISIPIRVKFQQQLE